MVYFDSQLFSVDGLIQDAGASYTISLNDLIYCVLSSAKDNSGSTVDTFMCLIDEPNKMSLTKVHYRRNSRTMAEFLTEMNAIGGGSQLKLWTDLRSFSSNTLHASDNLYDSDLILNDNYQINCIYSSTTGNTTVYFGRKNDPSPTTFIVLGNQIGSANIHSGFNHYIGESYLGGVIYHLYRDSSGLEHGLIVSLTEQVNTEYQTVPVLINADRTENGSYNTPLMTGSPAATYIATLGVGWYLPSIDELSLLYYNRYHVQKKLRENGNTLLSRIDVYLSSTENDANYCLGLNYQNGYSIPTQKVYPYGTVRGIKAF